MRKRAAKHTALRLLIKMGKTYYYYYYYVFLLSIQIFFSCLLHADFHVDELLHGESLHELAHCHTVAFRGRRHARMACIYAHRRLVPKAQACFSSVKSRRLVSLGYANRTGGSYVAYLRTRLVTAHAYHATPPTPPTPPHFGWGCFWSRPQVRSTDSATCVGTITAPPSNQLPAVTFLKWRYSRLRESEV
jgi:hypothetical protein